MVPLLGWDSNTFCVDLSSGVVISVHVTTLIDSGYIFGGTAMAGKANAAESAVMTVPEAGAKLGIGRNAAYEAAARGDIPTIRIGKLLKVPKVALDRMLEGAAARPKAAA